MPAERESKCGESGELRKAAASRWTRDEHRSLAEVDPRLARLRQQDSMHSRRMAAGPWLVSSGVMHQSSTSRKRDLSSGAGKDMEMAVPAERCSDSSGRLASSRIRSPGPITTLP